MAEYPTFTIEGANIFFKNFSGREGPYNAEGEKSFSVELPSGMAKQMEKDGWNVKYSEPGEDEEEGLPRVSVSVSFKFRPPKIVMISETARTTLSEDAVEVLDWADIKNVDLIIRGRPWEVNGKQGVKAYLKSMYVTVVEDELERKYAIQGGDEED